MSNTCNKNQSCACLKEAISALVNQYGREHNALMSILRGVQEKFHGVSEDAIRLIANELKISSADVQSVASFYHFFTLKQLGKFAIYMCQTISCKMQEAKAVADAFEKELGIKFGETTKDDMFTLAWTNCLGMCDLAPALLINDKPYTKVKAADVSKIIADCRKMAAETTTCC